jgi:hypothetical protein
MRRSIITSALTLVGTVAIASTATAQSTDIQFTGTVPAQCTFQRPTNGVLGFSAQNNTSSLSSQAAGGSPGEVTLLCNTAANLTISRPVQTGGPQITAASATATVTSRLGSATSNSSLSVPRNATPLPLSVNVNVSNGRRGLLNPGTYTYVVTLTATPR